MERTGYALAGKTRNSRKPPQPTARNHNPKAVGSSPSSGMKVRPVRAFRVIAFTRGCRINPKRADRSRSPHGLTIRATSASSTTHSSCRLPAQSLQSLPELR